jgi:transcriptional regulator with XRE-family HTH domain
VRAIRVAHGLSQEALAERADLHRTYVGSIEREERNVSLDNVERLAAALNVDISALFAGGNSDT